MFILWIFVNAQYAILFSKWGSIILMIHDIFPSAMIIINAKYSFKNNNHLKKYLSCLKRYANDQNFEVINNFKDIKKIKFYYW